MGQLQIILTLVLSAILMRNNAVGNLTSVPESVDGVLNVCPGDSIAITCTHNASTETLTQWNIKTVSMTVPCEAFANHVTLRGGMCSPFSLTMVSINGGPTVSSTAQASDTMAADGAMVSCFAGLAGVADEVGSINIMITELDVPVPSILSVNQVSQYEVEVSTSVADTQCVAMFVVNTTGNDSNGRSSPTSPVTVDGLDLCRYSYSFVGYVITPGKITGDVSAPVSFTATLSGVNGVANVSANSESTVLQWDQIPNTDYPDCITSYSIGWNGMTYNTADTATSVTRELLSASGFPFCMTTSVIVTPVTPMGLLDGRDSTADVSLISPDFVTTTISGVYIVNAANRIVFTGMVQAISQTVNPTRMIGYSRAGMACTPNTVFTADSFQAILPDDADSGQAFTMCVQLTSGDCMEMASRDFTIPGRNITTHNGRMLSGTSFTVTVNLPITEYQPDQLLVIVSLIPNDTAPVVADFPASYQYTVIFSSLMVDTSYIYTVRVVRRNDMTDVVEGSFTIVVLSPPGTIVSSTGQPTSAYMITITLPEINYPHSELIIISTLTPTDSAPITDDYPLSSQYSVTFNGLSVSVVYSYSIRIVLRRNTSIDVSIPLTGSFRLMTSFSTGAAVALTFILTFLLTLVVGVSIGVLIVNCNKCRRSEKITLQTETEMRAPPAIYEEPDAIKQDPLTQGNTAYGEIVH